MRASHLPLFTLKEDPKDSQVASHRLLARAGFIKKQASGLYAYMPFGYMVHRKIEEVIRETMNRYRGIEVHLPLLTQAELWQGSGRWGKMGKELMRAKDRHEHEFALAPTHEEAITWLASTFIRSYKQLPINLYQIGNKYRDEIRPRYGLIRGREFVMKDAYSFHANEESLDNTYQLMRKCYREIFNKCSLDTIPVQADSGNMGGAGSEEFMVASEIGEETLLLCDSCNYSSNQEKTPYAADVRYKNSDEPIEKVLTPNVYTISDVKRLLNADEQKFIKTVILEDAKNIVIAFIPGHRDLNEVKIKNVSNLGEITMASEEAILKVTGAKPGFAGPANLPVKDQDAVEVNGSNKLVKIFFDTTLENAENMISGANEDHHHIKGLNAGRDFEVINAEDLTLVVEEDPCPNCGKPLKVTRGIEVGHIFKLGNQYTKAANLNFLDEQGRAKIPVMGCYGIGIGRTLATIVEQNHDDKGIIWPEEIAPYKVHLIAIAQSEEEIAKANSFYEDLRSKGISVYYDDRKERPGVKFNDAELIGHPYQIVLGKSFFKENQVEFKLRKTLKKEVISPEEALKRIGL